MKLAIADNQSLKFDKELKEHWEKKHEVRFELGASEHLFQWCDLYYVNFWDHNIHYLWNWHQEHKKVKKPKLVCRALDWEVWVGLARSPEMGEWIDKVIAIAPHIKEKLERENPAMQGKVELIRPGIDLDTFTLNKRFLGMNENNKGYNIVIPCNEVDWYLKHVIEGIKIFRMLVKKSDKPWKLFVKGHFKEPEYFQLVIRDYIEKTGIKDRVQFDEEHVPDYNDYLEQMDYCLNPSLKEAFSFTSAQCMAKGIKPVLNNWVGIEGIWPAGFVYSDPGEAVEMLMTSPKPVHYRMYIRRHNNIERMLKEYDELIETVLHQS